jgi:hypothetical protein
MDTTVIALVVMLISQRKLSNKMEFPNRKLGHIKLPLMEKSLDFPPVLEYARQANHFISMTSFLELKTRQT